MTPLKSLIFIPTYNERENAPRMCEEISKLGLDADLLFVDDNSPDGTGAALEALKPRFERLIVQHRSGKLGIGSAHLDAINWAYAQGYELVVSLDCDFTHSPSDIPAIMAATQEASVSVGSRWLKGESLPGWNLFRRFMTSLGHLLTKVLLKLPHDATGAFRAYRLDRIPQDAFTLVQSRGYAFFFESLFILKSNNFSIVEIPIVLPARTYGSSKMTIRAAWTSLLTIFQLYLANLRHPERFQRKQRNITLDPLLHDPQDWDAYWEQKEVPSKIAYELIAAIYRKTFIQRRLNRVMKRTFSPGAKILHAGCGSGQVDRDLQHVMSISALDISPIALDLYQRNNPQADGVFHASIFKLPAPSDTFDGYYNMGVLEHFTEEEIRQILSEAYRILKRGGKTVIFWPHAHAPSVYTLNTWHKFLRVTGETKLLHPPEISLIQTKAETVKLFEDAGFKILSYHFGPEDLWIQAVIVAEK